MSTWPPWLGCCKNALFCSPHSPGRVCSMDFCEASGFRLITRSSLLPDSAMRGTTRQQSKSRVRTWFTCKGEKSRSGYRPSFPRPRSPRAQPAVPKVLTAAPARPPALLGPHPVGLMACFLSAVKLMSPCLPAGRCSTCWLYPHFMGGGERGMVWRRDLPCIDLTNVKVGSVWSRISLARKPHHRFGRVRATHQAALVGVAILKVRKFRFGDV